MCFAATVIEFAELSLARRRADVSPETPALKKHYQLDIDSYWLFFFFSVSFFVSQTIPKDDYLRHLEQVAASALSLGDVVLMQTCASSRKRRICLNGAKVCCMPRWMTGLIFLVVYNAARTNQSRSKKADLRPMRGGPPGESGQHAILEEIRKFQTPHQWSLSGAEVAGIMCKSHIFEMWPGRVLAGSVEVLGEV